MTVDTEILNEFAGRIAALKENPVLDEPSLRNRQAEIAAALDAMEAFIRKLARWSEETESSLMTAVPYRTGHQAGFSMEGTASGKGEDLLSGRGLRASGEIHYAAAACESVLEGESGSLSASVGALEAHAAGAAVFTIMEKKAFAPKIRLEADASAAALAASAAGTLGNRNAGFSASANGEAGALYAHGEAEISTEGVVLDGQVGAAALRGECTAAVHLFGATLSVTAQGSLASAEAGFSYHHKNREWELGSKLGFIAGAGIVIRVNY